MAINKPLSLFLFTILLLTSILTNFKAISQVYKYKDAKGNWVYSDKQPESDLVFEKINYLTQNKNQPHPTLNTVRGIGKENEKYLLKVKNPLFSPVEIEFISPVSQQTIYKVVPPRTNTIVLESQKSLGDLSYSWLLGDPKINADDYAYQTPFLTKAGHRITQGFNGRFSHQGEYSRYAVDIAMAVGTNIHAVREGTVVLVKDDYHMSGRTQYFLDKANVINVMHNDGTYALYAHILLDTAVVKAGDKVSVGQLLARSGSSGFSTGPHLHFMIFRNVGFKIVSIPFSFVDQLGQKFTPKAGMKMVASR